MPEPVIAIDIGNTNVHAGVVDTYRTVCIRRCVFPCSETGRRLPEFIDDIKNPGAAVVGGRRSHAEKAARILKKSGLFPVMSLRWNKRLPVRFYYKKPASLGADRIAGALYAAAVYPKKNVIIIDSGTAITVDAVNSRSEFIGGAILCGIGTQLRALHAAAGALPLAFLKERKIPPLGGSTIDCLKAGAVHGTAGALNHMVKKIKRLLGRKCLVLATGGGWRYTKDLADFDYTEVPELTIIGTALYLKKSRGH